MSALRTLLAVVCPGRCRALMAAQRRVRCRDELLAESGGVVGVQVDLVASAVDTEPDRLIGWAAVEIVV
jgi:hypothetical protein